MTDGFYVLTKEIAVPDPEGRLAVDMRTLFKKQTLKPGTRFQIKDGEVRMHGAYGGIANDEQAAMIKPHLEPAPYAIGQSLEDTAEETLAALSELGIVTKEHMERANEYLLVESARPGNMKELLYRNWINWYPS